MLQVHQHMTSPRTPVHPVSWRCGYILHFYRLWTVRIPTLMTYMGYVNAPAKVPGKQQPGEAGLYSAMSGLGQLHRE